MKKVLLIGAGKGGSALLPVLCEDKEVEVIGVVDINPAAPGFKIADELGIPTTSNYKDFLEKNHVDVVLNLTGNPSISDEIKEKRGGTEVLGGLSAKIMWNLVSERKRREEEKTKLAEDLERLNIALTESKEYLENILEHSADIIITTDTNRNITMFNRGAENMLGYKRDEVIGMPADRLYYDKSDRQKILEILKRDGSVLNYETKLKTKDGRIIDISLTISQLKDNAGSVIGTVGISKDITKRKEMETKLKETNQELNNFVYTVSHDLKAPLRAIDGFSGFLLEDHADKINDDGRLYLKRIRGGAQHMQSLINDLLELSKIGRISNPFEEVSISELLEQIKEEFQFQIKEKNAKIEINGNMPVIYCDKIRIYQVFSNLITNAIKFTKKGVTPEIKIGCEDRDSYWEFYVKDNGIGIAKEYHKRIFEIFQRLHKPEEFEGTGIGLTIVKRIIELHKGGIWLESEEGKGSSFFFIIPKKVT